MVHPISAGTLLRQRYLVQNVLGQGGFSRTYLALDQERFHEPCVLKELTVPYQDEGLASKSRHLFQREASILYQIQHPQIPRFWAAFEDEQRLFLVQSYIEGPTYRAVLNDRQQTGQAFSEAEVLHFLNHLLPVLTYIHERDIIHRDISPDNLILRLAQSPVTTLEPAPMTADLPVLIDFGAVKEATSHWPMMTATTRVGKVGYAPPEQLQTGKVYPNSDLYALAASCLALLTGREPRTLLDSQTLTWHWQEYAQISDELGQILQRMLAVYPSDRFPSAHEVWAAIQDLVPDAMAPTLVTPAPPDQALSILQPQPFTPQKRIAQPTQLTPRAIGPHASPRGATAPSSSPPGPQATTQRSSPRLSQRLSQHLSQHLSQNRFLPIGIAASIAALGIATPTLWQTWTNKPNTAPEKTGWAATAPTFNPSTTLLSLRSQPPVTTRPTQRLTFTPQRLALVLRGNLPEPDQQPYSFEGSAGQVITVNLSGAAVTFNVMNSRHQMLRESAQNTRRWTGQFPSNDRYYVQVVGSGPYTLDMAVTPPSTASQAKPYPILFDSGSTRTQVIGTLPANGKRRYEMPALQGQTLTVQRLQGKVAVQAIAPNQAKLGNAPVNRWEALLPVEGDYVLDVTGTPAQDYVLEVEIR
jgi:serine/threonine protein kinase